MLQLQSHSSCIINAVSIYRYQLKHTNIILRKTMILLMFICCLSLTIPTSFSILIANNESDIFSLTQNQLFSRSNFYEQESENAHCRCIPYYLCGNNTIITDGTKPVNVSIHSSCSKPQEICCNEAYIRSAEEQQIANEIKVCGFQNVNGVGSSSPKDNETFFGEFPWMAAVLRIITVDEKKMLVYTCGGSLIHPEVILTGAHCVSDSTQKYKVRVGEWDVTNKNALHPYQERHVKSIVIHPKFNDKNLHNDVALLLLDAQVQLAEHVQIVCLPPQGTLFDNIKCISTGWGKDKFGGRGTYSSILKKTELPLVNRQICQRSLRTTQVGNWFVLDPSFICAGGEEGIDTCEGDGGSPLVCLIPGQPRKYQLIGMVAWGIGCGKHEIPGVYVNVAMFKRWIDDEMAKHNFNKIIYNN